MKNYREVTYRVTGAFGESFEGELRKAYVLSDEWPYEGELVILYHPKATRSFTCASIGPAKMRRGAFEDVGEHAYVNLTNAQAKSIASIHHVPWEMKEKDLVIKEGKL